MNRTWHLILDGPCPGGYNMAVDETLLSELESNPEHPSTYLRFYQWIKPTLSLGFSQKASRVVNFDFCRQQGIDLVRRATGGKAVLHHQEITYAVISNDADFFPLQDILETYRLISSGLQAGLNEMGIATSLAARDSAVRSLPKSSQTVSCFALANSHEILCRGRKLAGSAQRRLQHAFLQHGSILIAYDNFLWENSLLQNPPQSESQKIATLREFLPTCIQEADIAGFLSSGFASTFQIQLIPFSITDRQKTEIFRQERQKYIFEDCRLESPGLDN